MNRSIPRVAVAALTLSCAALTVAPAQAAGPVVTKTSNQTAFMSWRTPTVTLPDGTTVTRDVFVLVSVDPSGTPQVMGSVSQTTCPADPAAYCDYWTGEQDFAGTPTSFSINKNATFATLAGTFAATTWNGTDYVPSEPVAVSLTWTGTSPVTSSSTDTFNYRGSVNITRSTGTRSENATVTGTVGGYNRADGVSGFGEIDLGRTIEIATYAVRKA
ncbi:MAG: hypothetical protein QOK14_1808 [Frankiaceae bacterium]|nr:hypothetical protein [Frankiaceae bacterium]